MRGVIKLIISLLPLFSFSQTKITGTVYDDIDPIPAASVILKDTEGSIISYTFTNENGEYVVKTDAKGSFILECSSLDHNSKSKEILIQDETEIKIDFELESEIIVLCDVIAQAKRDINQRSDTIIFDAKAFAQGNEEVVEDLLKQIPGLTIDSDGSIKVGNQEVEKVMVEGDDFFEKGYKILTKNMPAHPIDKIELLRNYSNNRLLKGIEESDRVALNLKLNEDAKRVWFGNMTLGYDAFSDENRYYLKANLMNFGKKNKFYFLTNLNNISYDATGDLRHLIRPMRAGEPASIGDDQSISSLISLNINSPNLKPNRTNFNNAEMASVNAIFNPTEKLKIRSIGFFNWDELDFFRNREDQVSINDLNFTNTENYHLRKTKKIGFGKLDLTYDFSDNQMLEFTSKYENSKYEDISDLSFNGLSTLKKLNQPVELFDQKVSFSQKFKNNKALLLTGRFIEETSPQTYRVNRFLFEDLFPNSNANNIHQKLNQKMTFAGFEAHLLDRKESKNLLELKLGNAYRKDFLNNQFDLLQDSQLLVQPQEYQNELSYTENDVYVIGSYNFHLKKLILNGDLAVHQLFNVMNQSNEKSSQHPFFINPSIGLDWNINAKNIIRTSYKYNRSNADVLNVYNNYVMTGFRNFKKGTGEFNQLDASTLLINYQLGNWTDRFFANTNLIYTKNHDFYSTNSLINQNFTQTEAVIIKDREMLVANTNVDYFIKKLDTNVKLKAGYVLSEFKNIVNNSGIRTVNTTNYNYGFEIKSVFRGVFNFDLGSNWITNKIEATSTNKFSDNVTFLDLNLAFSEKLNLDISSERYYFGNLEGKNAYYFLDFDIRYRLKKNKLMLMLSGKNLFNTDTFKSISITDISTSISEVRLLPRYVLLKLEYRFK